MFVSARCAASAPFVLSGLLAAFLLATTSGCQENQAPTDESKAVAEEPAPAPAEDEESGTSGDSGEAARTGGPATAGQAASATPSAEAVENPFALPREATPGVDTLVPEGVTRETTEGWWRIVFGFRGTDVNAGFVKFGKTDGEYRLEEIRTNDIINPAKVVDSQVTDKSVRIFFAHEDNKFDYAGDLADNVVRGNLQFATPRQERVRLVPVEEKDVTEKELDRQELGRTYGAREVDRALQTEDPAGGIRKVAKTWGTSPILFDAYDALLQQSRQLELDRATVEAMATEFETAAKVWGPRAEQAAKLNIAIDLMLNGQHLDLARPRLEAVRKEAPEIAAAWSEIFTVGERIASIAEASEKVDAGEVEAGLEALRRLHAEAPADPMATYHLAAAERKHGSKDEALNLFARLAALPQSEREIGFVASEADYVAPRLAAAQLFEEKNGSRDGLDAFLMQVYRENVTGFLTTEDKNRPATESARTTLVELFTGAVCPPCVAADVATEAVEHSFPRSDVVVLRYHLHNPGPDPLANTDTEAREAYYGEEVPGTPVVFIDGRAVQGNVGGGYGGSPEIYAKLAGLIAGAANRQPQASIDLAATVHGNVLRIGAKASPGDAASDDVRLRLVVAESQIDFAAGNGVLAHEMIVREMPGGAAGIAAVNGEFNFEQEVPLTELRDRLESYLDQWEKNFSKEAGRPFTFTDRPVDLRKLTVVAFLQNDATHEVLQAAVVPIEQEIELPPVEKKPEDSAGAAEEAAEGPALGPAS